MLFDYSKAYDTVWRTGLLQKMLDIGVQLRLVQWTIYWLTNRIARVRLNGETGRCRAFKDGLLQGSVLSPLLFVLYINDLLGNFSESTMVSAYADDLALACRDRKKEEVALRMQAEVDKRPLGIGDPQCTHPPRRKAVVAHPSSLDCFMHDPTPRRRRGPPPKSRLNRPHPIPLRTPSPPPTLATYDRNVGDGHLPTLCGARRLV